MQQFQFPVFDTKLNKTNISTAADNAVAHILEQGNPLQAAELISAMENFIKEVKANPDYVKYVREEASKDGGKLITTPNGTKIEPCETGTKYDFLKCNDFLLPTIEKIIMDAETNLKERQAFLKALPAVGIDLLDTNTGEMVTVFPPSKTSTSSFKVTLSK